MYVYIKIVLILDDADDSRYAEKNTIYSTTETIKGSISFIQGSCQKRFQ